MKFVHVTGTNGKGSTCAIMASILRAAGYRTGLYTSPFLIRFNERMQVDGRQITDDELCEITAQVRPLADSLGQTALGRALQLLAAGGAHQPADDQKDDAHDDDGHRAAQYCADGRNHQAQTGKEFAEARQGTAAAYILHIVIHLSAPFHAPRTTRRTGAAPR